MNRNRRTFAARYPGRCLCGASFPKGAQIFWDGSVRRATLCPSCRSPKAIKGEWKQVDGVNLRIDTHPKTGAPIFAVVATLEDWYNAEVYRLQDGKWRLHGGGMVFTSTVGHMIPKWIEATA